MLHFWKHCGLICTVPLRPAFRCLRLQGAFCFTFYIPAFFFQAASLLASLILLAFLQLKQPCPDSTEKLHENQLAKREQLVRVPPPPSPKRSLPGPFSVRWNTHPSSVSAQSLHCRKQGRLRDLPFHSKFVFWPKLKINRYFAAPIKPVHLFPRLDQQHRPTVSDQSAAHHLLQPSCVISTGPVSQQPLPTHRKTLTTTTQR